MRTRFHSLQKIAGCWGSPRTLTLRAARDDPTKCVTRSSVTTLSAQRCMHTSPVKYAPALTTQTTTNKLNEDIDNNENANILANEKVDTRRQGPQLTYDNENLVIRLWNGTSEVVDRFPHFWLRDNCRCSKCVNQDTMQRAFDTFSIPEDVQPSKLTTTEKGVQITWSYDGHESVYPWNWLAKHHQGEPEPPTNKELWKRNKSGDVIPPSVQFEDVMASDAAVGEWTNKIYKFGFCFVHGCPVSPEQTKKLLERIAFIRETHYGGFYDFTSDLTMKDTAYTSLALPAHTDTTYFTDPAGLQMFHMLSHTEGEGGHSLLVDGFEVYKALQEEDFQASRELREVKIPWHASGNDGITITPYDYFPVISGSRKHGPHYFPRIIRWNNDDRGVLPLVFFGSMKPRNTTDWYRAAKKWDEITKRKHMEYWFKLEPGTALIFDNWRVMHGRSAFTGKRRMCGGYINHDDYVSRWRNTNFSRDEVLSQIL